MIESFLHYIQFERHLSVQTVFSYRDTLYKLCEYIKIERTAFDASKLSVDTIRLWFLQQMDQGISPRTINRKLSTLKSFYKYLTKNGLCKNNPTLKIIPPKNAKKLPVFFQEKEMDKILEIQEKSFTFEGKLTRIVIDLFYQTGIRVSELIHLIDDDIDFSAHVLRVFGKGSKERFIPFGSSLESEIKDYLSLRTRETGIAQTERLFVDKEGKPLSQQRVYLLVRMAMGKVSSLQKRSPHVLRHTFATTMLNHGADLNVIKDLLGHTSLTATQVYTHTTFDQIHQIYEQAHPRALKSGGTIMEFTMQALNFDSTAKLEAFIEKKVKKLERLSDEIGTAKAILKVVRPETANNKEVEITLLMPNAKLFASKVSDTFEESCDLCCAALEKQLERYKDKK